MFNLKKAIIKKELETLYLKEFISKDNFEKIVKYYDLKQNNHSIYLAVIVGFLFLGLSLLCLVAYNWEDLSRVFQTIFLLCLLLGAQILSFVFKNENLKIAFAFFSSFALLANMALLSQIYHLGDNSPLALLLTAFCALLLASHFNSFWLFIQSYCFACLSFTLAIDSQDSFVANFFVIFLILGFLIQFLMASKILALINFIFLFVYVNFLFFGVRLYDYDFMLGFLTWYIPLFLIAIRAKNYYNISYITLIFTLLFYSFNVKDTFLIMPPFSLNVVNILLILLFLLNIYFKRFFIAFFIFAIFIANYVTSALYTSYELDIVYFYFSVLVLSLGLYLIKIDKIYLGLFAVFAVACMNFVIAEDLFRSFVYLAIFGILTFVVAFFATLLRKKNEK